MCGLVTIIASSPATAGLETLVGAMMQPIAHRGPDDRQVVVLGDDGAATTPDRPGRPGRVALGFHRLAILDLTDAGRQPMRDPSGRFWVILNGEIYNYLELGESLRREGVTLRSRGDTEVLLHLLVRHGEACLPMLDGMFAFVAVDTQHQRVLAARDRFGIKPLYHWQAPDGSHVLASEIKAFTAHPQWRARMNGQRTWDYLSRGLIDHTPGTMFDGVRSIPAGHAARFDLDATTLEPIIDRWYELKPTVDVGPEAQWPGRLSELLHASVRRHLRSDVTVGSCLSGGLDSSSIVCLASEILRGSGERFDQKTFTARSEAAELDEWRYAREVAAVSGARAVEVWPRADEVLSRLDHWVWVQDEPFSTPSMIVQHAVFAAARAHGVTVMLDGQGADEQLGGYHSFFPVLLLEQLRRARLGKAWSTARAISAVHGSVATSLLLRAVASGAPAWMRRWRRRAMMHDIIDAGVLGAEPVDPFDLMTGRSRGVREFSLDLLRAGSLPALLHWEDRNSMAHGVEARVPFLQHDLVEFVLGLPAEAKIDGAMTKGVLRQAMAGHVPESVRMRTDKIAFAVPERQWLCGEQMGRTIAALDAAREACGDLMRPGAIEGLRAMIDGRRAYNGVVWRVLCLGAWMQRFNVAMP